MNKPFSTTTILRSLVLFMLIAAIPAVLLSAPIQNPAAPDRPSLPSSSKSGNKVEPLSNQLDLTMTPDALLKKFGPPHSDERAWGGGIVYNDFAAILNAANDGIWDVAIYKNVKLNSGIGIGDSKDQVLRVFPGGAWSGENYSVSYDQYNLSFFFADSKLGEIQISPVLDHFAPYKKSSAH